MEASSRVFSLSFSWRIRSFISFWERAREWVKSVSIGFVVFKSLARWIQGPSVGRSTTHKLEVVNGVRWGVYVLWFFQSHLLG
jgi:hypothetical protein